MNNTTNTINTEEPKWYVFSAPSAETIYGQFDNDEHAEEYRQILSEDAGTDIYSFRKLESDDDFRQIASEWATRGLRNDK